MSDVLHRVRFTPMQTAAMQHAKDFRAGISQRADARSVSIKQAEAAAAVVPVRRIIWRSPDEIAFGPIVAEKPKIVRPCCTDIIRATAQHFKITKTEMLSKRRQANLSMARHVAMFLCKSLTLKSLPFIGRELGNRDHTTVIHGVRRVHGDILLGNAVVIEAVDTLTAQFPSDEY